MWPCKAPIWSTLASETCLLCLISVGLINIPSRSGPAVGPLIMKAFLDSVEPGDCAFLGTKKGKVYKVSLGSLLSQASGVPGQSSRAPHPAAKP